MVKTIIYSFIITIGLGTLVSCKTQPPVIKYKTVDVAVQYTATPPPVTRPTLDVTTLTPAQKADIGELGKAYVITAKQLMQYACLLEKVYNQYATMAKNNPSLTPSSSSTAATPAVASSVASASIQSATTQVSNIITNITLTPQDYQDCAKVGP
jgi:hypothetical protein